MLCPKCQQPLEDGAESYICCASASLQWRCQACAKVSEGFAFPYGMCPHCGGKLETLDPRHINEEAALGSLRKAFEIELGGRAFYLRAAADSDEPVLKDLFGRFAAMEQEHMQTLQRRYHARLTEIPDAFQLELAAIFAGVPSRPADPANLFRIAIGMEQRATSFFERCAQEATQGSQEQQLYRELAAEEREHASLLATEYARWREGKPGLLLDAGELAP